jgi:two-component system cell cycle response regulator CtrA
MVSSEVLSRHLYGGQHKPKPKFIDVFACHLPIKRGQTMGGRRYIETVWGRGYRLSDPAQEPLHSQT